MASRSCFAAASALKFSFGKIYKQPMHETQNVKLKSTTALSLCNSKYEIIDNEKKAGTSVSACFYPWAAGDGGQGAAAPHALALPPSCSPSLAERVCGAP